MTTNYGLVDKVIGENGFLEVRPHLGVDHMLSDAVGSVNLMLMYHDDVELFKKTIKLFYDYYKKCLVHLP